MTEEQLQRRIAELESELDEARAKAALYGEAVWPSGAVRTNILASLGGEGRRPEPNDLEPDRMFYFLRITADKAYRIDMGGLHPRANALGYAHLEVWED